MPRVTLEAEQQPGQPAKLYLRWQQSIPLGGALGSAILIWYLVAVENLSLRLTQLLLHVSQHRWYLVALGLVIMALGWLLGSQRILRRRITAVDPQEAQAAASGFRIKRSTIEFALAAICLFTGFGALSLGLVGATYPVRRLSEAAVGVITNANGPQVDEPLRAALDGIRARGADQPAVIGGGALSPVKDAAELLKQLERLWVQNPDLVVIGCFDLFDGLKRSQLKRLLNPFSLYLVVGPVRPELLQEFPNLVSLGPSLLDEVLRISRLIPLDAPAIEVFRADTPVGHAAAELLDSLLLPSTRRLVIPRPVSPGRPVSRQKGAVAVVLDWSHPIEAFLKPDSLSLGESALPIIASSQYAGTPGITTPRPLYIRSATGGAEIYSAEDATYALLESLVTTYYLGPRGLSASDSLDVVRQQAMEASRSFVSAEGQLIPRYQGANK